MLEVFEYINEHPTTAEILAAVHEVRTQASTLKSLRKGMARIDPNQFESEFNQMPEFLGQPEKAPDDFWEHVNWVNSQLERFKAN